MLTIKPSEALFGANQRLEFKDKQDYTSILADFNHRFPKVQIGIAFRVKHDWVAHLTKSQPYVSFNLVTLCKNYLDKNTDLANLPPSLSTKQDRHRD